MLKSTSSKLHDDTGPVTLSDDIIGPLDVEKVPENMPHYHL